MNHRPTYEELEERVRELEKGDFDRNQVLEALKKSEEKFRVLFDNTGDAIIIRTMKGRFLEVNQVACDRYGYSREEFYQMSLEELSAPGLPEGVSEITRLILQNGHHIYKRVHVTKEKKMIPVEISSRVLYINGQDAIICVVRDITERKQAEEALKREAIRRRILVDQSRDGIVVLDQNGKVYEANQKYADMLGYSMEEVHQLHVWDWDAQWSKEKLLEMAQAVDETGDHFETRHQRKDGTIYDVEISTNGAVFRGQKLIFCVCRDITERKRAEEELRKSKETYHDLYKFLRLITDNVPDMIWAKDMDDRFLFANQAICDKLLMCDSPDQTIGKTDMFFAEQERKAGHEHTFGEICVNSDAITKQRKAPGRFQEEGLVRGEHLVLDVQKAPFINEGGKMIGTVGCGRDITKKREVEAALKESEEKYRFLVENSNQGIVVIQDERVKFFNPKIAEISGYSEDDAASIPFIDFIHPDDRQIVMERHLKRLSGEEVLGIYVLRCITKGGDIKYLENKGTLISWESKPATLNFISDITEKLLTESALRESEEKYRSLVESTEDSIYLVDRNLRYLFANEKHQSRFDLLTGNIIGSGYGNFHSQEETNHFSKQINKVFETGQSLSYEHHSQKDDKYFIRTLSPVKKNGTTTSVTVISKDITKRKFMENAVKMSEKKYRSMMEAIADAVYICSPDFRVEYMNPMMIRRVGYDATGEACHKAINNLDERCPWCVHDKIQRGENIEVEISSPKCNRIYHVIHSPIHRENGSISKLTVYRDITDRERLMEKKLLLSTAIEQAAESIFISDEQGTIQYINPALERISGYTSEEIVGKNFGILKSDEHDEAFYKDIWEVIFSGNVWAGRISNRMKDGSIREFETRISPVKNSSGDLINFVSVNRDISEEIALKRQLRQSQKMQSIGTMAGGIAHDFNNILAPIIGCAELLMEDAEKGSDQYESLQEILQAGMRARDLIKQILLFSRQSDQKLELLRIQFIVREVLQFAKFALPSTINIRHTIEDNCGWVMADATQIHQIVMNLITNAYHSMEDKGGQLEINLKEVELGIDDAGDSFMTPGAYVRLKVSDTGVGMEEGVLDRIFEPYFTTKGADKGTGLGLSVVHGIVKSCGGDITVYSEPGKGSAFHVYLPVTKTGIESEVIGSELSTRRGNERILVVDDEENVCRVMSKMLKRLGYDVTANTSSADTLALFRTFPDEFDLVITDMTMPNLTGLQLSQELLEIRPDIPIIICTGFSEQVDKEYAKKVGIREFVLKPVVKAELSNIIRKVLDGS